MLNVLLGLLILAVIAAGCYYAALKYVELRHNRDMLADELKRATEHIGELETRIMMLEAERDTELSRMEKYHNPPESYDVFGIRS